jgi:tripartite-type tricarboxylate transporter receptor subunit TctC
MRFQGVMRLLSVLVAGFALFYGSIPAFSQTFPSRPIRMIVPFPPGGNADVDARIISEKMSQGLGQPVLVENRSGATSTIGIGALAKSAPDGHVFGMVPPGSVAITSNLMKLPYDPYKDLTPLSGMTRSAFVFAVSGSSPFKSMRELIAHARANPAVLSFGSSGVGSSHHLTGELVKKMAGIDLLHVPFKGAAEGTTAVLAGQIDMVIGAPSGFTQLLRAGRVRALAVSQARRTPSLPDVPTIAESGVPGYAVDAGLALYAPGGTPGEIVSRMNAEIVRVLKLPDVRERILAGGEEPDPTTPEEQVRVLRSEMERFGELIKTLGLRPDQ